MKLSKLLIPTAFSLICLAILTEKEVLSEDLTSLTTNPSHSISDVFIDLKQIYSNTSDVADNGTPKSEATGSQGQ